MTKIRQPRYRVIGWTRPTRRGRVFARAHLVVADRSGRRSVRCGANQFVEASTLAPDEDRHMDPSWACARCSRPWGQREFESTRAEPHERALGEAWLATALGVLEETT